MRRYFAFTVKELTEQLRTYKTLIIFAVFFFFGLSSPLLAKLLPEIFASMKVQGMTIAIPTPTSIDAYGQFFKNMTQMGMIVTLLVFSGMITQELSKGTLINMLSKGLSRNTVVLSKYSAALLLWTIGYAFACFVNYGYTTYLFPGNDVANIVFSSFCLWLFGAFLLALILFSSMLASGSYGGLLVTAVLLVIMLIANSFPSIGKYNPVTLASNNMALITNKVSISDTLPTIVSGIAATVFCLLLALVLFKKKKL